MSIRLNPYLAFRDNAREAMEFYHSVFGGTLTLSTFGEFGMSQDPAETDKIMHGQLESGELTIMAADTPAAMQLAPSSSISVSLSGDDETTLRGYWDKLSEGARIGEPLARAPWGDSFGMLVDRFGTTWMVNIAGS